MLIVMFQTLDLDKMDGENVTICKEPRTLFKNNFTNIKCKLFFPFQRCQLTC